MGPKLLILGAGEMQVPIIKKAKEKGIKTLVADINPTAPGIPFADDFFVVSTLDYDSLLSISKKEKIDGILTTSDAPVNVVSKIASDLNLPSMSTSVANICTNKYLQRLAFAENNINIPFFRKCTSLIDIDDLTDFPYIVKPVDSSASRGVTKVNNKEELISAFNVALSFSKSRTIIIESFIEGKEFSVETFTQYNKTSIINITEKITRGENEGYFVEDTHIQPARINSGEWSTISKEVLNAIKVIGLNNCPSHTEVKLFNGKAYIIEIACRLGGDYITSDLIPLSTGVDMLDNLISVSLGKDINVVPSISKYSAVQFLNNENYYNCLQFIESGDSSIIRYEIKPYNNRTITNSLERLGYIIIQSESLEDINNVLHKLM